MSRPRLPSFNLEYDDRQRLKKWLYMPGKENRHRRFRAKLILRISANKKDSTREIAQALSTTPATVALWHKRFSRLRVAGLEETRGRKVEVPPEVERRILKATREGPGPGAPRWSSRKLADKLGITPWTVQRTWKRNMSFKERIDFYKRRFGSQPSRYQRLLAKQGDEQHFNFLKYCLAVVVKRRAKSRARLAWSLLRKGKKLRQDDWREKSKWWKKAEKRLGQSHKNLFSKLIEERLAEIQL